LEEDWKKKKRLIYDKPLTDLEPWEVFADEKAERA
jgi:hypothetical protein